MMVGEMEVKERPRPSPDYLMQLLNEKKLMTSLPNLCGIFTHLERLLDEGEPCKMVLLQDPGFTLNVKCLNTSKNIKHADMQHFYFREPEINPSSFSVRKVEEERQEITRVRKDMYNDTVNGLVDKHPLELPEPVGPIVHLQEKLFVPVKEYPDYNFVGRILGPRGLTAKQLEAETGCKIMVRGRSSMRDRKKEEQNRGKPNWEHLNEELHVLITVEDTQTRAEIKMRRAVEEVKKLLVPAAPNREQMARCNLLPTYFRPIPPFYSPLLQRLRQGVGVLKSGSLGPGCFACSEQNGWTAARACSLSGNMVERL
ncbi:hypothetical protein PO909_011801 [Leuciscus waleckii]